MSRPREFEARAQCVEGDRTAVDGEQHARRHMLGGRLEPFRDDQQRTAGEVAERAGHRAFDPPQQAVMLTRADDQQIGAPRLRGFGQRMGDIGAVHGQVDDFAVDRDVVAPQCAGGARQRVGGVVQQFVARRFEERGRFRSARNECARIFRNADHVHRRIRRNEVTRIRERMIGRGGAVDRDQHPLGRVVGVEG